MSEKAEIKEQPSIQMLEMDMGLSVSAMLVRVGGKHGGGGDYYWVATCQRLRFIEASGRSPEIAMRELTRKVKSFIENRIIPYERG